jgi:hypothetical protein
MIGVVGNHSDIIEWIDKMIGVVGNHSDILEWRERR